MMIRTLFMLFALALQSPGAFASCDEESGKRQYNKCIACHSTEPGVMLMGPSLHGVIGRQVGTVKDFVYSLAMEEAGFTWTEQKLSEFLEKPMAVVPGSVMPFGGIRNPGQRGDLVCYIKTLSH